MGYSHLSTLYVSEQGALLSRSGERLIVKQKEKKILERHFRDINRILLFGNVQVTTQTVAKLLKSGIDLVYFSTHGTYRGQLVGVRSKNIYLKAAQMSLWKNRSFSLNLAQTMIEKKISGQLAVLNKRRHGVNRNESPFPSALKTINEAYHKVNKSSSISSLRGIEGSASAAYFSCWDGLLPEQLQFNKRSRRPALNELNSAMNFSYTLLLNEVNGMLESHGFDPIIGYYHSLRYGRVSLALDVMEMFRPLLVDQWLITLVRKQRLVKGDFVQDEHRGFIFTDEGRKKFLKLYHHWHKESNFRFHVAQVVKGLEQTYLKGQANEYRKATENVLSHLL